MPFQKSKYCLEMACPSESLFCSLQNIMCYSNILCGVWAKNFRFWKWLFPAFEILVVCAPGTTKKVAGQPKILMQSDNHKYVAKTHLSTSILQVRTTKNLDGQPEIVTWLSVGQYFSLIRTLVILYSFGYKVFKKPKKFWRVARTCLFLQNLYD